MKNAPNDRRFLLLVLLYVAIMRPDALLCLFAENGRPTMFNLEAFTDRREALALFDLLRGRDPHQPWPLLPILTFLAPGGSGKSTLIEYLRVKHCSLPDGRAVLPYARLD